MGRNGPAGVLADGARSLGDIAILLSEHRRVGLDTSVFIYHIESTSRLAEPASVVLRALAGGAFVGITSVVTLMEITVRPLQQGRPAVAEEYEVLLANYPNLVLAEIDRAIARQAAWLRARYRCRPADALQMATSLEHAGTAFVTNDRELQRVTELRILILEDFA